MIVKTMPVGPIGTNCYLLGDETSKACAMIDPGGDPNEILSMIREAGLALKAILLTHGHPPLPREVLRFYDEGDTVAVGGLTVEVLHTPGHSKGSVVLKTGDILFTGDTLFRGSCGRTDLPGGSYQEIMTSLARLGRLAGDYRVCPGHEGLSTLDAERRSNYYLMEALAEQP